MAEHQSPALDESSRSDGESEGNLKLSRELCPGSRETRARLKRLIER